MADRTRQQLIADLAAAQTRSNSRIHEATRVILQNAPAAVRRATVPEQVVYAVCKLVPWPTSAEIARLNVEERTLMRAAHDHTRDVVTARLAAEARAAGRPSTTLATIAPPGQVRR